MFKKSLLLISLGSSLGFSAVSNADESSTYTAQATANMNVYLTVLKACSISASEMNFGKKYSNAGDLSAEATANVVCTKNTPYKLSSDSSHDYEMSDTSGNKIAYNLYTDQAATTALTSGTTQTGTGLEQNIKIYGQVSANALKVAPAGDYTDTVLLKIDY
ncbi:Csu type fimbrial protein [Tatumella sp. UBA2305]|uniref:Csu type fimbrial protein n=1 Tax=Tatumella sp. UBA2305 TaxID=1947647 RepID=UPI0025D66431|nr:spore coat U domain-containing protein [Tatumella sp. UBA2305]